MGAFNTKQDAASTEKGASINGQNESSKNIRIMENAVSKIKARIGPEILDNRKPHGLVTPVDGTEEVNAQCVEENQAGCYKEFNLDVEYRELMRRSTDLPSTCYQKYFDPTAYEYDKNTHVKKELLDQSHISLDSENSKTIPVTTTKDLLNPFEEIVAKNEPVEELVIKQELIEESIDLINTHVTVHMLQSEQISLKIKEELLDQSHISLYSGNSRAIPVTPTKDLQNPFEAIVAKNEPVKELIIKKELIEESIDLIKKFEYQHSYHDNKLLQNTKVEVRSKNVMENEYKIKQRAEKDFEQKAIKRELIEEKVEIFESNGNKHKKPTRWITNPFAFIASVTKEYAFPGYANRNQAGNISKDLITENNKIKNVYPKLLVNPFTKSEQLGKFDKVKSECESFAPEPNSEQFSDYHSLCNSSFVSLPPINDSAVFENNTNAESLKWMVKLPENPYTPVKNKIKRSTSIEITLENTKPTGKRKTDIAREQKNIINLTKSKQANKTNTKIIRRNRPNTRSRRKFSQKNKVEVRGKSLNKAKRRGRRRMNVTDKTYYCPTNFIKHSSDCRMRLRARPKDSLANKQITLFPKPLLDQKSEIVAPPAPIQKKELRNVMYIKCDGMQPAYESMPLVDKNQFDSKNELNSVAKVNNSLEMEKLLKNPDNKVVDPISQLPNSLKAEMDEPIFKLEKSLKTETDYDSLDKSTSLTLLAEAANWMYDDASPPLFSKSINVKQKGLSMSLDNNCKLLKSLQPRVCVKRLSHPAKVSSMRRDKPCFIDSKNENMIQMEKRITSKNFETSPKTQLKSEFTPPNAVKVSKMLPLDTPTYHNVTNLQRDSKPLQSMQPKVCLQRFPLPKNFERFRLVNTCDMQGKCATITKANNVFELQSELPLDLQQNLKLLQSMQPKVRLKRLRSDEGMHRSSLANTKHELNPKRAPELYSIPIASNLQPIVRLRRLNFADIKLNHCTYNQNLENNTKQLKVDLEVKRKCNFYEENAAYALRKRNMCSARIKEETLSPKRRAEPLTSTPIMRIEQAFSLQPIVRLKRLENITKHNTIGARMHSNSQTSTNAADLEMRVKMEALEVDDEQLTPISFAKQYDEEDSGVSLDSAHNLSESFGSGLADETVNIGTYDDILFEIALQRARINYLLLRNDYSPIQFRLYNNVEELKIFLDYLLAK